MYGFISIENTVEIFGAGAALAVGEVGGGTGTLCCHICHRCFLPPCAWRGGLFTALTRSCRDEGHNRSPLFHYCHQPMSPSGRGDAGVRGATECRPTARDLPARCLWWVSNSLYSSSNCVLSEPVKGVTSCGSRSCE